MKGPTILRVIAAVLVLLAGVWIAKHTRWEEVEVEDPARGAAATDPYYSLRQILAGAGSTLEVRTSLEPLPPPGATLYLASRLWDIFPERDARLRRWVEAGGHLVVLSPHAQGDDDDLRWVPLTSADPKRRKSTRSAKAEKAAASASEVETRQETEQQRRRREKMAGMLGVKLPGPGCEDFAELPSTTQPAFEPGRVYHGCQLQGQLHALDHAVPSWGLASAHGTLTMRVPVGDGSVTGVSRWIELDSHDLLQGDNALIAMAVLQAGPKHPVWIVDDESREPIVGWLWHEARTPFLLTLAAVALSLWRLMVRFGPREAPPPQARRSMGEQVRGTGHFIAGSDAQALHAATRKAFDDVARTRVEGWNELADEDRVAALAEALAPTHAIDRAALLASFKVGGGATSHQILTAIAVLEQARRALLHAAASPFAH